MHYEIPKSYFVYEFSYPEGMPELAGIVFYVGKGTNASRMDNHLNEAANGCTCAKCKAIRSVWGAGLVVVRRIVFESQSESEALNEERRRIFQHKSPYLTNMVYTEAIYNRPRKPRKTQEKTVYHQSVNTRHHQIPPAYAEEYIEREIVINSDKELELSMMRDLVAWGQNHHLIGFTHK